MRDINKPCVIICSTNYGYITTPHDCESVAEAKRYAEDIGCDFYRIFDITGELINSGTRNK